MVLLVTAFLRRLEGGARRALLVFVYLARKARHKATTRDGVPQVTLLLLL